MKLNKLFATLWKCWRIRCRHYMITLFVIFIPIILYGLLAWGRTKLGHISKQYINETTYIEPMSEYDLYIHHKVDISSTYLLYTPSGKFTDELMREVQLKMEITNHKFHSFPTEIDLLDFYHQNVTSEAVLAVVFNGLETDVVPKVLNYSIRDFEKNLDWQTDFRYKMQMQYVPGTGSEKYFLKSFINLQLAIDKTFLAIKNPKINDDYLLYMEEFPYPPHSNDIGFTDMFMNMLPLVTLFCTVFIFPGTLKRMMEEKESGIKELTKMMGLPPSIMYLGWFIDAICPVILSAVVCTIMMKATWGTAYAPVEYCNGPIYGIFLLLYFSSCVAFCLCVASMCDSPSITTSMSVVVWIITYVIPYGVKNLSSLGYATNLLLFLVPNFAMNNGFQAIAAYEMRGNGAQWYNLFTEQPGDMNSIPLGYSLVMLLVDIVLLLLFGFYIDQVLPGKYGLPKPWNYPLIGLFNKSMNKIKRKNSVDQCYDNENLNPVNVEDSAGNAGIAIKNLTKRYGDKVAVQNMSVRFFEGEIAVLLGRNGAGKTTTMSVLTGMTDATHGEVLINDYDINENLSYVRSVMGMCPQHDLLFPELTVFEHVLFFAKLHDIRNAKAKVKDLLEKLNIYDKRHLLPQGISGGMKRKLCLAMAMISNPAVLILDEPTSGLDPKSRRDLWDLILGWRSENPKATILVSTHFMEEADVLGDRITIMESGKLVAQGTPMYLKNAFANECYLTIPLQCDEDTCNTFKSDCMKVFNGKCKFNDSSIDSLTIITPNDNKNKLIKFLETIEYTYNVKEVAISVPSIEDVFLKLSTVEGHITEEAPKEDNSTVIVNLNNSSNLEELEDKWIEKILKNGRFGGFSYQWKRYIPFLAMSLAMIFLLRFSGNTQTVNHILRPELQLQLNAYGKTVVFYSVDTSITESIAQNLEKLVKAQGSEPIRVPSVSGALVEMGVKNLDDFKQKAVVALEFNTTSDNKVLVNMMYSNSAFHGAPIVLNLAMNVLNKLLADTASGTSNLPLQTNDDIVIEELASEIQIVLLWVILAPIALLFLVSSYINYPLQERVSNFKHLVYMSGVNPGKYWFQMCFFHYVVLYVPAALMIFAILVISSLYTPGALSLLLMLLWYGALMIPCVFVFSYKKSVAAAVGSLTTITIFTGLVCPFVVFILQNSPGGFYKNLGYCLNIAFFASPQYWLTKCMTTFTRKAVWIHKWDQMLPTQKEIMCKINFNPCCGSNQKACNDYKSFFYDGSDTMYGIFYLALIPFGIMIFYFVLLCILDSFTVKRILTRGMWSRGNYSQFSLLRHRDKNHKRLTKDSTFNAVDLKKEFNNNLAVDKLSFSVKNGECFGLLGINGAGKTTTFNMITGLEVPTEGSASITSKSVGTHIDDTVLDMEDPETSNTYFQNLGYCPQFNAVNEVLPARKLLQLFASYRSSNNPSIDQNMEVKNMLSMVGLDGYEDVPSGTLSGGNKRKLCLGIALIGSTSVGFLDEPTTGVDPVSRRKIWSVLADVKNKKQCPLVLTSHSMDECEKLCDSLAIMKKGQICKKGNVNQLKLECGNGLTIKIKLRSVDQVDGIGLAQDDILRTITDQVEGQVELKDKHESLLHYFIPEMKCHVGDLRKFLIAMEELKGRPNSPVEDYTISTSSLEDVFLAIAREG